MFSLLISRNLKQWAIVEFMGLGSTIPYAGGSKVEIMTAGFEQLYK